MSRWAAVLGKPISHSLSPVLHRAAYAALGLDWSYTARECDEAALPGLLADLRHDPNWAGLSLTMPLKTVAAPLLDDVEETAAALGAVNTVVPRDGLLTGANTDVDGILYAMGSVTRSPKVLAILGAGGTARAALGAAARLGLEDVIVSARRPDAAGPLVRLGELLGVRVDVREWGIPDEADVVIATTPAGATDTLAGLPWPADRALIELLYHPWPTALAARARSARAPVAGGLAMLAGQAVGQVLLFTGQSVDVRVLSAAGELALAASVVTAP